MKTFFWWCAGADDELLRQCPKSEHIKFTGIGATVLFTGLLASFSGGYALYTVFGNVWSALGFGLLWGAVIFNLDRFIVSTLRKEGHFGRELLQVLPRLALALLIAVVVSKPLELRIFQKEIDSILQRKQAELTLEHQQLVARQFTETDSIKSEIGGLKAEVAAKEQERARLYEEMKAEADGTGGTGKVGKGPIFEEKRRQHDKVEEELKQLQVQIQEQIAKRESRIGSLTQNQDSVLARAQQRFSNYDGLMARMTALEELPFLPSLFIMLLFIALETAPIFTKLISQRGPYDLRLKQREHEIEVAELDRIQDRQRSFDTRHLLADATHHSKREHEAVTQQERVRIFSNADLELIREESAVWVQRKKELLQNDPDAYFAQREQPQP